MIFTQPAFYAGLFIGLNIDIILMGVLVYCKDPEPIEEKPKLEW